MEDSFGFEKSEIALIKKLNTPQKIQDFINSLEINFDYNNEMCQSPRSVLRSKKADCIEGAVLAAAILRYHGYPPLIMSLESTDEDDDHVVTLFKQNGYYGAISKTNHAVLRYREPIYKTLRELALSYFHEYFLNKNGKKTLRRYSKPVNLKIFDNKNWISSEESIWYINDYMFKVHHYPLLNKRQISNLRPAEKVEISAGEIVEYKE